MTLYQNDNDDVFIKVNDGTSEGLKVPSGQQAMASSVPVVIASNQTRIPVSNIEVIPSGNIIYEEMNVATGGVARDGAIGTTFTNIYSYTGSGYFHGFTVTMETSNIWTIRITIDGVDLLFGSAGLAISDIDNTGLYSIPSTSTRQVLGINYEGNAFRWTSPTQNTLSFTASVLIRAKVTTGTKKFRAGFVVRG